jgi:hypothetical protein
LFRWPKVLEGELGTEAVFFVEAVAIERRLREGDMF